MYVRAWLKSFKVSEQESTKDDNRKPTKRRKSKGPLTCIDQGLLLKLNVQNHTARIPVAPSLKTTVVALFYTLIFVNFMTTVFQK